MGMVNCWSIHFSCFLKDEEVVAEEDNMVPRPGASSTYFLRFHREEGCILEQEPRHPHASYRAVHRNSHCHQSSHPCTEHNNFRCYIQWHLERGQNRSWEYPTVVKYFVHKRNKRQWLIKEMIERCLSFTLTLTYRC